MTEDDDDDGNEQYLDAVKALVSITQQMAKISGLCPLCIAHGYTKYIAMLERQGIATHERYNQDDDGPEIVTSTIQ